MDLCQPEWFDSTNLLQAPPTSVDLTQNIGTRNNRRKREITTTTTTTTNRIGNNALMQPEEQFNQVLNNYFNFTNPTSTTWFQQGLFFFLLMK